MSFLNIVNVREEHGERRRMRRIVVVMHKMDVVKMCDWVVVVKDGEAVEEGVYKELLERDMCLIVGKGW